jgi:hypothetical protein
VGGARASHCVRLQVPGGRDPAAQLCGVTEDVISTGRVESAVVYCEAELDVPQWPWVVWATTLQFPSNDAAIADGVEQMAAEAATRAVTQIRIGGSSLPSISTSPLRRRGDRLASQLLIAGPTARPTQHCPGLPVHSAQWHTQAANL